MSALPTRVDGSYPAYAWPGGYPIQYFTSEGAVLCSTCASDPDIVDPAGGETLVGADIYWEGPELQCEGCERAMESAYGDPEVQA